ncbi:glycine betaine ABC transporter substrate-binding protein [Streptomyces sp. DSM 44915]|uniref:Glycine betaine ABC transporter substrate-binding protein n=1 Tax=Streptomyces chisholmiae TaxID=3075540 RepID=A0ABU2JY26_9ACTN|nr:glycine betaine ABC transporter substrate-binding protein [Streptomyces sp. DSM 44915]MDT0269906.1 glycine betaine ABC transporter substrate-binding protein [Streptomyces sp. DSM 44915]
MRTPTSRRRQLSAVAVAATLGLTLAACGDSDDDESNGGGSGGGDTITLGYIPSWTDGLSTAYLLEHLLEEAGYTVEHEEISEAGVLYTALAEGDVDMFPSAWPEVTHASYMEQYGDRIEDIGAYYDNAVLTFAVPEYSEITSIAELPDYVDVLDGRIVGIEPGAGLTEATQESVIPTYGLDEAGFSLATSSTSTMLTELGNAIDSQEEIVVTLWRPFWANAEFPVRDLEDPEGALGEAEALHFLGREGFGGDFPEVAEWIAGIQLSDEEYGALEDLVVNQHPDDPAAGVAEWLEEHADVVGAPPAAS